VITSASALAIFLLALLVWLQEAAGQGGYEFAGLAMLVSVICAFLFGLPTLVLAILLFVRRLARGVAQVAVAWMAFCAVALFFAFDSVVGVFAAAAALVVLCSLAYDRQQRQAGRA